MTTSDNDLIYNWLSKTFHVCRCVLHGGIPVHGDGGGGDPVGEAGGEVWEAD